jgi:PTH1 family peptidyl-tRNA hydrolase
MRLIVGLGNPGNEYVQTRHNVGFMVIDRLARRHGLVGHRMKFHAEVTEGLIATTTVMLIKPTTYMNRSGTCVGEVTRFYKVENPDLLVVMDDTALPLGRIRLRPEGGHGGHNGLADIERVLGTTAYPRLRVGVDRDEAGGQIDHVLGRFTPAQIERIEPVLDATCDAVESWIADGINQAMNRFNTSP